MNDVPISLKFRGTELLCVLFGAPMVSRDVANVRLAQVVRASVWETGVVWAVMKSTEE